MPQKPIDAVRAARLLAEGLTSAEIGRRMAEEEARAMPYQSISVDHALRRQAHMNAKPKYQPQCRWSPEEDCALLFGRALGLTWRQIAQLMNMTEDAIGNRLKRLTLRGLVTVSCNPKRRPPRITARRKWPPVADCALLFGRALGLEWTQIAQLMGTTKKAIGSRLKCLHQAGLVTVARNPKVRRWRRKSRAKAKPIHAPQSHSFEPVTPRREQDVLAQLKRQDMAFQKAMRRAHPMLPNGPCRSPGTRNPIRLRAA